MTIVLIMALVSCTLTALYMAARSRRQRTGRPVQPLDLKAFSTLMDRSDEQLLREKLSRSQFFMLKRRRIRVSWQYVGRIGNNARVILRLGQAAHMNADADMRQSAAQVVDLATQVRAQCLVAMAKLAVEYAFPSMQLTPAMLVMKYQALRDNASRLGVVQQQPLASLAS